MLTRGNLQYEDVPLAREVPFMEAAVEVSPVPCHVDIGMGWEESRCLRQKLLDIRINSCNLFRKQTAR